MKFQQKSPLVVLGETLEMSYSSMIFRVPNCSSSSRISVRLHFLTLGLGVTPALGPGMVSGDCCNHKETNQRPQVKNTSTHEHHNLQIQLKRSEMFCRGP